MGEGVVCRRGRATCVGDEEYGRIGVGVEHWGRSMVWVLEKG